MKIVQFSLSQALVLKFVFNFFAAHTLFCSYTNDSVSVCVCARVCELLGEMPRTGDWNSASFY